MKEALVAIHQMREEGVIGEYAIGGAVGATFYLEPVATLDLDVFIAFTGQEDSALISLAPLYSHLTAKGYTLRGEYVVIGNWPVQFLPTADELGAAAVAEAVEVDVAGTPTRVMTAEHLVAIALQLGRGKDHARVLQFVEAGILEMARLMEILKRYGLLDKWNRFERRFLDGDS